jgi:[acyl-carrier-protein] S-malonyltransferase
LATWVTLSARLPAPTLFAGYSVGELAAYGCAGALPVDGVLRLAQRRAELMDRASGAASGLVAVRGLKRSTVDALCAEIGAEIAIINGPDHFILGGPADILGTLERAAFARGASTARRLRVGVASHTSRLAPASRDFALALAQSDLTDPATPVLAGINGMPVRDRTAATETLARQLSCTVDWQACLGTAMEMDCRVFLELGPGCALARMARELSSEIAARSVQEFRSLEGVTEWVAKQVSRA